MNTSLIAAAAALLVAAPLAAQTVPAAFGASTAITNAYAPVQPGATQILRGRADGERTTTVIAHLVDTRSFDHAGQRVTCRVVEEKEFAAGALVEITRHYLAQDDDGCVWSFGEVAVEYEDGAALGAEADSWIVGGASEVGDPRSVHDAHAPQLYMPARLAVGDVFVQDDVTGAREVLTVLAVGEPVAVPAGDYAWAVKLAESSDDDGDDVEYRWVVPGVGHVKEQSQEATSRLHDSTLVATVASEPEEIDR